MDWSETEECILFFQVFPFSVVFDSQLTIIYVGRTLQKLFSADPLRQQQSRRSSAAHWDDASQFTTRQNVQLIGRPLGEHFCLIRPQMTDLTWQNVRISSSILCIILIFMCCHLAIGVNDDDDESSSSSFITPIAKWQHIKYDT